MKVFGRNVLKELLSNPKDIKKIYLSKSLKDQDLVKAIKDLHLQYETVDNRVMDGMVEGNHQGVVVIINDYEYSDYHDMFNDQVVVMLDHLEDPHNFGAIIRTCEAAGIKSIIIPKDRSVDVNSTVMKTSAGALEYVNVAMVSNLNKVIDEFKNQGYFVYGAEADGTLYSKCNYSDKMVLVIGSEGNGLSRLVRENCDEIVSLPMNGHV